MTLTSNQGTHRGNTGDESYVSVVRHPELLERPPNPGSEKLDDYGYKGLVMWLGSAVVGGFLCGFAAFLLMGVWHQAGRPWSHPTNRSSYQPWNRAHSAQIAQTVVPVTYLQATKNNEPEKRLVSAPAESKSAAVLEEVRTRNRRLEALVKVLRKRDANDRRLATVTHSN